MNKKSQNNQILFYGSDVRPFPLQATPNFIVPQLPSYNSFEPAKKVARGRYSLLIIHYSLFFYAIVDVRN